MLPFGSHQAPLYRGSRQNWLKGNPQTENDKGRQVTKLRMPLNPLSGNIGQSGFRICHTKMTEIMQNIYTIGTNPFFWHRLTLIMSTDAKNIAGQLRWDVRVYPNNVGQHRWDVRVYPFCGQGVKLTAERT